MARRKYRGIDIDVEHLEVAKNLDSVHELIDELRDLQSTWNNLSLLGELTNVGAEISNTRHHFQTLANDLSNFLIEQSTRQAVDLLSTRAQNAIDILIRNLYERTADIGFLATDPVFRQVCQTALENPISEDTLQQTRLRMKSYVANYSVYKNVILLDTQAEVIVDMQASLPSGTSMEWVRHKVQASAQYAEAFQPLTENTDASNELIYAWKITNQGQLKGFIVLVFNLEEESEALFSKVVGQNRENSLTEWRVCGVTDASGKVLVSSNPQYIGSNQTIRLPANKTWGIAQIGPVAYLSCIRPTRGYQGYAGPGWLGFCLVPLNQAFNQQDATDSSQPKLDQTQGLIDPRILGFQDQATQIQKQLNRSIWNGNITQRNTNTNLGESFSKTLLWEISRAGEKTKELFRGSLDNMVQKEINGFQTEQQTRAMLAIDLMDRNLYERANDCRWWALDPTLRDTLSEPYNSGKIELASACLKHINSLYTVYTNILLLDNMGKVICDSTNQVAQGTSITEPWVEKAMRLKNQTQYCVSDFEKTTLYEDRPTYIYSAAIFDNPDSPKRTLGAVALVFNSEPQFEAILNESMGEASNKAFAFIVDEQRNIISSTTDQYIENGKLTLPFSSRTKFEKQAASHGYFDIDGQMLAYGFCNSGSYREYKSSSDAYKNNLTCIYGIDVGRVKIDDGRIRDISFDEFRQTKNNEQMIEVAAFRVGEQWYGINSEEVVEAFLCNQIVSMPNTPPYFVGTTLYKKQAISIVDITRILAPHSDSGDATERRQMILLKTRKDAACVALAVDELGEIPNLPISALHESGSLHGRGVVVRGLIKTIDNLMVILNSEQLLHQLENGIEKGPFEKEAFSGTTLELN